MTKCPACLAPFGPGEYALLALHLHERAMKSDPAHVRWLNQNLSRKRLTTEELEPKLREFYDLGSGSLTTWIKSRFIQKFYGRTPHPFVTALQHPSRATLLGYVVEHQHFLRQWVRSCAYIMARSEEPDVAHFELDNLNVEFQGFGDRHPSHYELLLRMGESLGLRREEVLASPPLPATLDAIAEWDRIARSEHWVEALAAMHSLELIASRDLVKDGASLHYFDPSILRGNEIPGEAQAFLREGYEADVGHSEEALALVERFASRLGRVEDVQATFLRSIDLFDDYLMARLERADRFEA
jgi:pyrroloquinoline-quinone synthase